MNNQNLIVSVLQKAAYLAKFDAVIASLQVPAPVPEETLAGPAQELIPVATSDVCGQLMQTVDFRAPQNGGTMKSKSYEGAKVAIEYHATLDMAKELAMVEFDQAADG